MREGDKAKRSSKEQALFLGIHENNRRKIYRTMKLEKLAPPSNPSSISRKPSLCKTEKKLLLNPKQSYCGGKKENKVHNNVPTDNESEAERRISGLKGTRTTEGRITVGNRGSSEVYTLNVQILHLSLVLFLHLALRTFNPIWQDQDKRPKDTNKGSPSKYLPEVSVNMQSFQLHFSSCLW